MPRRRRVPPAGPIAGPSRTDRTGHRSVRGRGAGRRWWAGWVSGPTRPRPGGAAQPVRADGARRRGQPQHGRLPARRRRRATDRGLGDRRVRRQLRPPRQAYIDNATRTRLRLLGTVTDAGLESQNGDQGRVLVAVTVKSADPAQEPRFLRMRLTVQKMGDVAKVSDVGVRVMTRRRSVNWSRVLVYGCFPVWRCCWRCPPAC